MFENPNSDLFDRYGVTYLYVGTLEREGSADCGLLRERYVGVTDAGYPGSGWDLAFQSGEVAVFRRLEPTAARSDVSGLAAIR